MDLMVWREELGRYAVVECKALPGPVGDLCAHVSKIGIMFPDDWNEALAVAAWSALWAGVRTENQPLALWFLGVNGAGWGKNITSDEAVACVTDAARMGQVPLQTLTSGTPEGLTRAVEGDNQGVLAYYAEYAGSLRHLRQSASGKEALMNLYDGRDVAHRLAGDVVVASRPHVTLIGTTTMSGLTSAATREDLTNGYLSRFLTCAPDCIDLLPEAFPTPAERAKVAVALTVARANRAGVSQVNPDPRALVALGAHATALGVGTGRVRDLDRERHIDHQPPGRQLARIRRVAALLALADDRAKRTSNVLHYDADHVRLAVRLVGRGAAYESRLRHWILSNREQDLAERVLVYLVEHGTPLSARDLARNTTTTADDMRAALVSLEQEGLISRYRDGRRDLYYPTPAGRGA